MLINELLIKKSSIKEPTESGDLYVTEDVTSYTETANRALEKNDHVKFQRAFLKFEESLTSIKFETLVENGCKKRKNHEVLQFLPVYVRMMKRLLNFIQASRSRDWVFDVKSAEEMMLDFSSMNQMKYHRMWPIYIADMYNLQHQAPDVWAVFMRGDFSCQKSSIPGMAIGQDHAAEQENKITKNRDGITGITGRKQRNKTFPGCPYIVFYI